jgi:hypothetical protein
MELNLTGTALTDKDDLQALAELKSLRRLDLAGVPLSAAQLGKLRAALPQCQVWTLEQR